MDMSMEIDDENADKTKDIFKEYLKGKIHEIKLLSAANAVKKCHVNCLEILQKSDNRETSDLKLSNTWQRVHNKKLIIGICVENSTHRSAKNISIVLNNDSGVDLTYTTKLYTKYKTSTDEGLDPVVQTFVDRVENLMKNDPNTPVKDQWIPTQALALDSIIVIVLDLPQFISFKLLNLEGMLLYEKDSHKHQIHLPKISLDIEDVTSEKYAIQMTTILSGTDEAYLSLISASLHTPVKIIIPAGTYRTLDGLLQIDCSFTRTEVNAREYVLVYDGPSRCLKDVLLRVSRHEKQPIVDMYTRNGEQLQLLYHHLYNKIPGLVILNKDCETNIAGAELRNNQNTSFVEVQKPSESVVKFMDSFRNVLVFTEEKLQNCLEEKEDEERERMIRIVNLNKLGNDFRQQLADLEKKADEHLKSAMYEK